MALSIVGWRQLAALLFAAAALQATATGAFAQARRIQGKVVDEQGQPVVAATVEAAIVSLAYVEFAVQRTDQTWDARTNANGDYIITVPQAGEYLVTATKDGVGSDRRKVGVQRSGLVTANFTLWKAHDVTAAPKPCGTIRSVDPSNRSPLAAGTDAGLTRLLAWFQAVQLHTPGCADSPALEVARWSERELAILLRDIRALVAFLRRTEDGRGALTGRGGMQRDQLIFSIYGRRLTLDELQRDFYGGRMLRANDVLSRGGVLHADIGIFVPGDVGRFPLVEDGGRRGWRGGSPHWEAGRQLLDGISPAASADAGALLWYRAVSAYLFRDGNLAELTVHLNRARQVFTQSPEVLFDSAYLHQELSSPSVQASVQQLRADDVSVRVDSRRAELQRAERFFREALMRAPNDSDGRIRFGHTLGELGRHNEAAGELRRAIEAGPDRRRCTWPSCFSAARRRRSTIMTTPGEHTNALRTCILTRSRRGWPQANLPGKSAIEQARSGPCAALPTRPAANASTHGGSFTNRIKTIRTP